MSKGEYTPSAVGSFGFTTKSTKGKAHPEGVSTGPNQVETLSGTVGPSKKANASGARSVVPSGVRRGDGTETRRGITVRSIRSAPKGPSTSGSTSALPSGVVKHSGLSAPKRVR